MRITPNQTTLDVAIMATGNLESLFEILAANNKSITDIPHVGDDWVIPSTVTKNVKALQYIKENKINIGTGDDPSLYIGISYWQIEVDFKVS